MKIDSVTHLNIVIGFPLAHSQSPLLHRMIYKKMGINAVMLAKPHSYLPALIKVIKTFSVSLTAVTSPYKEKIIQYLDYQSQEVKNLRVVNTLIQTNKKLYGYNTDVDGIAFALRNTKLAGKQVLVIGAGGAAHALAHVLRKNNASLYWLNRTTRKAFRLAEQFSGRVINKEELNSQPFDVIVNTTPIGMFPNMLESPLDGYVFNKEQVIFDMVYNPAETQLLKQAMRVKARVISGLDMFIGQALKQVELLTEETTTHLSITSFKKALVQAQRAQHELYQSKKIANC